MGKDKIFKKFLGIFGLYGNGRMACCSEKIRSRCNCSGS